MHISNPIQSGLRTVASASLLALLAACGGGGGGASDGSLPTAAATATAAVAASASSAAEGVAQPQGLKVTATPPAATIGSTLTVRARASMATGVTLSVRVDGVVIGTTPVRESSFTSFTFPATGLHAGSKVEVVFNATWQPSGDQPAMFVAFVTDGITTLLPAGASAIYDRGTGAAAFDGQDTQAGQSDMWWPGALRLTWPAGGTTDLTSGAKYDAARFLRQATFGATVTEVNRLAAMTPAAWIAEQQAMTVTSDYLNYVQSKYSLGADYLPQGSKYSPNWTTERFWASAANSPDQLRRRVAFALHHIFMVSMADSNLYHQGRAVAAYMDTLNKHAFGNYRTLLEEVALSPAMGIYLSHMRNRKEDAATSRLPDENFARELMQLFTIGLYELNADGTVKRDATNKPIETYTNADVMAMAKAFTGWSWAFPDNQLTENNFRWGNPSVTAASDQRIDYLKMRAYPGMNSTAEKRLFVGKPQAVTIPANSTAEASVRMALDALFNHPNVGPFIGRQLIQHLTTSNPSPAYVARVTAVFNNNGSGVRGDLGAVVRAILLDTEARQAPTATFGSLREPVLRVTQWMRAFNATSSTGDYMMGWDLDTMSQRVLVSPSVFGYFRPGYVPPNSAFSATGATAPEFQIVNESTSAAWINTVEELALKGVGWTGSKIDVTTSLSELIALSTKGDADGVVQRLNLLLFAGRMSDDLRIDILDAMGGVGMADAASHNNRVRVALLVAMASPEYLVLH